MTTVQCIGCEAEYAPNRFDQLYCSRTCKVQAASLAKRYERMMAREDIECPCCHEVFHQRRVDQQFCSAECRVRANGRIRQGLPVDYQRAAATNCA